VWRYRPATMRLICYCNEVRAERSRVLELKNALPLDCSRVCGTPHDHMHGRVSVRAIGPAGRS
jgi:hypothetical protein